MEKKKDELLNFAFNEQDEKIKFYRETLVEMTKEVYQKAKLKDGVIIESIVKEADELTEAIIKKVDEFEQEKTNMWSPNYDPSYNMTTTIIDHLGFEGNKQKVNPDYLKTEPITTINGEPMRTIVDNGPQYQPNQKPYDTLGEHKEELQKLYQIKEQCGFNFIKDFANNKFPYSTTLSHIKEILGVDFIKDFIKACEKCEE